MEVIFLFLKFICGILNRGVANYFWNHVIQISSSVRHVTGTGSGILGGIPRVVVQISALTKRATIGVRAPYATRRKLWYEANQVWVDEHNLYFARSAIIRYLAVET